VQGIVNAILALLHFHLGGTADLITATPPASRPGALAASFAVVVAGGDFDLGLDLLDAGLDLVSRTQAIDDGGVVLVDGDLLGLAEHGERDASSLMPRSSLIISPAVSVAMSPSMALRRSPKPGP
jgi:hypothetical protein